MSILTMAILFFTFYIIWVIVVKGIEKSVSMTDYTNDRDHKNAFELVLSTCGIALICYGIVSLLPTLIISGALIIGVAIFSDFKKNKLYKILHMVCAFGGFIALAITPIFLGAWYLTVITASLTVATYFIAPTNKLWWTELMVIYSSFTMLYLS